MSRVLKFRIWDKANKEYKILGATGLDARNGDVIDYYNEGNRLGGPEEYDVEQYTGSTDKNGQEIYEGDIVGIYQEYSDKEGSKTWEELEPWGQVTYEDSRARFGIWGDSPYEGEDRHFFDLVEGLEVIGNIHENKELWSESD